MLAQIRFAVRSLVRARGFTIAAVACLALGIAANSTVFSVTEALVLHPIPTKNPANLVMVAEVPPVQPSPDFAEMTPANYLDLARTSRSFQSTAAFADYSANVTGIDEPERVLGYKVTANYFAVLAVKPALGRQFTEAEVREGAPPIVILSDGLWRRRFGADPAVVGRTVQLDGTSTRIVGVMPAEFVFPPGADLWVPLPLDGAMGHDRDARNVDVLARLKPGVSIGAARAETKSIMRQLELAYPAVNAKWGIRVENADTFYGRHPRPFLLAELGAVLFVLLIACANVANLLLARATARGRELAVRVALGASRTRLVGQLLAESLVLSVAGTVLGVVLSFWGFEAVRKSLPPELLNFNPGWMAIGLSPEVLLFTGTVCVLTAVIVGVVPAVVAAGSDPQQALGEGGRGSSASGRRKRLRSLLVVAEMALALVMISGTTIMVRGFQALSTGAPGYRVDHALTFTLSAPEARYPKESAVSDLFARVVDRLRQEPGVENAAVVNGLPPAWNDIHQRIYLEGEPRPTRGDVARRPRTRTITPTYFAAMGIPLLSGRTFTDQDDSAAMRVIVVDEEMARRYWPGMNPVGKRIGFTGGDTALRTIIGVVGNVRHNPNLGTDLQPHLYNPLKQSPTFRTLNVVVRTSGDPGALAHRVAVAVSSVDPSIAPGNVSSLERMRWSSMAPQRVTSSMMAVFAIVALVLAAIGIYGVMSYTVAQRTHDIGVRTALGARRVDILRQVLTEAFALVGVGMAIGLVGALGVAKGLQHLLAELSPTDPLAFAIVVAILAFVALLGSLIPARRAAAIDPVQALRVDG